MLPSLAAVLPAVAAQPAAAVTDLPCDFFPISYWVGPPAEDDRYAELAECNFTLALNGDPDLAHKHGLRWIVGDRRVAGIHEQSPERDAAIDAAVAEYASRPGFLGLYLKDEPNSASFPQLAYVNQRVLQQAPDAIPYVNLFPTYATAEQLGNPTYEEHVEEFVTTVKPRVISYDHYALVHDGLRPDYYQNLEIIRRASLKHGVLFWYILLVTPHGPYRDPSEGELRWQVYTSLAYGCQGILYFTYFTPHDANWDFRRGLIRRDGTRDRKFDIVKRINAELKRLGPTLLKLTSTKVYHVVADGELPRDTQAPPADALVQSVSSGHLVVGEFAAKGRTYVLLANGSYGRQFEGDICLSSAAGSLIEVVRREGQASRRLSLPSNGRLPSRLLAPGDGRLYEVTPCDGHPS
jgi:hypothetical protein